MMIKKKDDTVTLAYIYGLRNSGDFALNLGALDILTQIYDINKINMISRFSEKSKEFLIIKDYLNDYYGEVNIIGSPFNVDDITQNPLKKQLNITKAGTKLLSGLAFPKLTESITSDPALKAISESKFLFCNGGNLYHWNKYRKSYSYTYGVSFPFLYARKVGVPYGFLPQSIGDIEGNGIKMLKPLFEDSKYFLFREEISKDKFKKTFNLDYPFFLDLAFYIKHIKEKEAINIINEKEMGKDDYICFTLREEKLGDIGNLEKEKIDIIENKIKSIIDYIINDLEKKVLIVCQTKKDLPFTIRISNYYSSTGKVEYIEEYDPLILKGIYKNSLTLIAMRLHSAIYSLSVGTPVIGIFDRQWGPKLPGTFGFFNMKDKANEVYTCQTSDIINQINDNMKNKNRLKERILKVVYCSEKQLISFIEKT